MQPVPFTQYLLPDGRQRSIKIDRPDEVAEQARKLMVSGCRFEVEILRTGDVSLEVISPPLPEDGDGQSLAIEIVANGPGMHEAVDRLVAAAAAAFSKIGSAA